MGTFLSLRVSPYPGKNSQAFRMQSDRLQFDVGTCFLQGGISYTVEGRRGAFTGSGKPVWDLASDVGESMEGGDGPGLTPALMFCRSRHAHVVEKGLGLLQDPAKDCPHGSHARTVHSVPSPQRLACSLGSPGDTRARHCGQHGRKPRWL